MATAVVGKTDVGVKEFGRDVDVAEVPQAKLMYYLDCICYALNLDKSESGVRKLRDYRNYRQLSSDDIDELLILCALFSPDVLLNKCIFMDEDMCGNDMNKFYELNAVSKKMIITEQIVIGGQTRKVMKILCFRKIWLECFYIEPIAQFKERLSRIAGRISGRQGGGGGAQRGQRQVRPQTATRPIQASPPAARRPASASNRNDDKSWCVVM